MHANMLHFLIKTNSRSFLLGEGPPPEVQEARDQKSTWLAAKGLKILLARARQLAEQLDAYDDESDSSSTTPPRRTHRRRRHGVRRAIHKSRRRRHS